MIVKTSKPRILIADDDPVYREVAREALTLAGYDVALASDGAEAIEILAREPFEAATIDLTMPRANGLQVISATRAAGINRNTPIVVITGHDDAREVEQAYDAGATSFLTKPVNWQLFAHHINFIVRAGRTETELRETTQAAAFLSDLKSQMFSALSREFQMPIKTIFGFTELIRREVYGPLAPAGYRDMLLDIGTAAQRLNSAFLKLMDLGNVLNEQLDIKGEQFMLVETLKGIVMSVSDQAERRSVRVTSRIEIAEDVAIEADRVLFIQAVRSVIANAVRLAPRASSVDVRVSISETGDLRISASDTGPPISAAMLAEMSKASPARPGAMLDTEARDVGIKIAKVLTEAHHGQMHVRIDEAGTNLVRLEFPKSRLHNVAAMPHSPQIAGVSETDRLAQISAALAQDPRLRLSQAARGDAAAAPAAPPAPATLPRARNASLFDIIESRRS